MITKLTGSVSFSWRDVVQRLLLRLFMAVKQSVADGWLPLSY